MKRTPLYNLHQKHGAKFVQFAGYEMPIQYETGIVKEHISTRHLEDIWEIEDEWYNFKDFNPNINELLNLDEKSYSGGKNGEYHPITWYHEFEGGRSFYTALGHKGETYKDERFIQLLLGGILYAAKN